MEDLNMIITVFLVVNTLFVFRQKLWQKSISTPVAILASDIAYVLYSYGYNMGAIVVWAITITGLVANSAFREYEPYCIQKYGRHIKQ